MHLLATQAGAVPEGEAVDLGQDPAEVVFLSAADTELACLAAAHDRLGAEAPTLRLASLLQLGHNLSVDLYVDRVVAGARLVVLRLLGGAGYWPYGLEQVAEACRRGGVLLAVVPGDDQPDPELSRHSTLPAEAVHRIWQYCVHGGVANAAGLLRYASHLLGRPADWREPAPLLRAGIYWPGLDRPSLDDLRARWAGDRPVAAVVFYRALVQAANTEVVDALVAALDAEGLDALPVFTTSLKEAAAAGTVAELLAAAGADVVLNATSFAVAQPGAARAATPFDEADCPVLQVVFSGGSEASWRSGTTGLSAKDIAMNVALPEVDGRILTRAVSFKAEARAHAATQSRILGYRPVPDRVRFVARLAAGWARLRRTPAAERRVALVLANYPNRDGRLANGVGLDTPAGVVEALRAMAGAGYRVEDLPKDAAGLMDLLSRGVTNDRAALDARLVRETLDGAAYRRFLLGLPAEVRDAVTARWGEPEADPFHRDGAFRLPALRLGNAVVAIQPARGYDRDPARSYHDPDLVPPHAYLAFYAWLREGFGAHAIVHFGKHGNLEWLPGKSLALSEACFPEAALGPLPHLYPFIVNDPGEGSQAKRRAQAVVIDHLTPPLTRAESYGPLRELETLVDEYYEASSVDPRRLVPLRERILELTAATGLDRDCGIDRGEDPQSALAKLDNHLCELKELQIRDGLHVFGVAPDGDLLADLLVAIARLPRGRGEGGDASLHRALADDLGLGFDPLDAAFGDPWTGPKPAALLDVLTANAAPDPKPANPSLPCPAGEGGTREAGGGGALPQAQASEPGARHPHPNPPPRGRGGSSSGGERNEATPPHAPPPWRTVGDTVERIEILARRLVAGEVAPEPGWTRTRAVLDWVAASLAPAVRASGQAEIQGLLRGLAGRFVEPGPSGAPTRGRPEVLPTGRNFYSVDTRAVPTPAAWQLGWKSAARVVERYLQEHGEWPRRLALSAWGTANMRTGGDDLAQALALMGVRPTWDSATGRVTGFEIMPASVLDRPRVDVTLRVSGFFRDAFPAQIELLDAAARAVARLDEPDEVNALAASFRADRARLLAAGAAAEDAERRAGFRVFGSKPGAYGAGLQALIDERGWETEADLAEAYLAWGAYAYGAGAEGRPERELFERRLGSVELVLHNQDNREHDLLDSDDYYQFEGGLAVAVRTLSGKAPEVFHNDHSRPESPRVRTLKEEVARVVRARVVNPKWIRGVMRHGYKGAFEMAATVDYLFAFAATARCVGDHHFDAVYDAYLADEEVRGWVAEANPAALREMAERLKEALDRGLWRPRSNHAHEHLGRLAQGGSE